MLEGITTTEALLGIVSLSGSVMGFYVKRMYDKMDTLEENLQHHILEDAKNLVTRDEMLSMKDDFRNMLSPISSKLDSIESYLRNSKTSIH